MITVLATCHNRRATTLSNLAAMRLAAVGVPYRVVLVDDGSTDGTGDAVRANHPEATVVDGDGSLYWNGGMRKAWQSALSYETDYYLLWNDDLELAPGALAQLLALQQELEAVHGPRVITVGKVTDPDSGQVTYGGYVRTSKISRLRFGRAPDGGAPCATMNANCVLVPARAVADVGILSEHFRHGAGDIDYGLRAVKAGYRIVQSPFSVGCTPYNDQFVADTSRLTWSNRHFILKHPKGAPVDEWLYLCRTHAGWLWPVNFVFRYLRMILPSS